MGKKTLFPPRIPITSLSTLHPEHQKLLLWPCASHRKSDGCVHLPSNELLAADGLGKGFSFILTWLTALEAPWKRSQMAAFQVKHSNVIPPKDTLTILNNMRNEGQGTLSSFIFVIKALWAKLPSAVKTASLMPSSLGYELRQDLLMCHYIAQHDITMGNRGCRKIARPHVAEQGQDISHLIHFEFVSDCWAFRNLPLWPNFHDPRNIVTQIFGYRIPGLDTG